MKLLLLVCMYTLSGQEMSCRPTSVTGLFPSHYACSRHFARYYANRVSSYRGYLVRIKSHRCLNYRGYRSYRNYR